MLENITKSLVLATLTLSSVLAISSSAQDIKCNPAGNTLELRKCASDRYAAADKKLNQVYQQNISKLSGEYKNRLIKAQTAWITFRDTTCNFEAGYALGGTLEPLLYTRCLERVTSERTTYLQQYFSRSEGGGRSDNNSLPKVGTVRSLVDGDLMCYATLVDEKNIERKVGATFDICAKKAQFLNKKVRLTYAITNVNDCQSSEPCGKTRQEMLITKMEIIR
ncbi:MAG TPA: lysozyme inhibitor LprI family protein [Kamptonema sp.]|nr:lysozyme inhibitor LprI family protein [Kamptonema sp.]